MVSPNLFLKLNISYNLIIGFLLLFNTFNISNNIANNLLGLFFIYISINNIIILRQKTCPKLKKNILKINTLLYCIIGVFILLNIKQNKRINNNDITSLILNFFALTINFIGFKITKI